MWSSGAVWALRPFGVTQAAVVLFLLDQGQREADVQR
jgi:hypothetical protein